MLDVSTRTVLIVGGGAVAARKAKGLLEGGGTRIRCVSPEFCPAMPAGVERVTGHYEPQHLAGVTLVFVATDRPEVNETVVRDARSRNILVNRADPNEDDPGDFTLPAKLRRGQVIVTVSAGSPALSAEIRDRLQLLFDPRWELMADAMRELRPFVKQSGASPDVRQKAFRSLAREEAFHILDDRGPGGLREWLVARHPELDP